MHFYNIFKAIMQYVKSESKAEADIIVTSQMGESVKYIMISRAFYPVLN